LRTIEVVKTHRYGMCGLVFKKGTILQEIEYPGYGITVFKDDMGRLHYFDSEIDFSPEFQEDFRFI
jgi:hypothetical protein